MIMNFIFFSTSDNFHEFHRKREIEAISERAGKESKALLFNKPKFFLRGLINKDVDKDKSKRTKVLIKNLYILLPLKIALKNALVRYLFIELPIKYQINKNKKSLGDGDFYHIFYKPDQFLYLPKRNSVYINYDNYKMDKSYFFSHSSIFDKTLRNCIENSFLSLFSSYTLLHEMNSKLINKAYYYPNAIDRSLVEHSICIQKKSHSNKMTIGFVGQIDESFDELLLEEIATNLKDSTIILIGPVSNPLVLELVKKYENIYALGFVQYDDLANYIKTFDVGICPYKKNEFNRYRNPLKIYEYFSYGVPAVSVQCDIDSELTNILSVSNNYTQFVNDIKKECFSNNHHKSVLRKQIAAQNCWDDRANFLFNLIEKKNASDI